MIKLLIAEDHLVVRSGLQLLLENQADIKVIGEAGTGREAIEQVKKLQPDVLLLDINMPEMDGLMVINQLNKEGIKVPILVLTMHDNVSLLTKCLENGAAGYILKKAPEADLLTAIRTVASGGVYLEQSLAKNFVNCVLANKSEGKPSGWKYILADLNELLTEREVETLKLVALGYTDKEIAETMFISIKTVESYKARIKDKLNIKRLAEMVRIAVEAGLLDD
jgi:two-component system response regulator NreC